MNNEETKTVRKLALLGVLSDSKLNFTGHMSSTCKKASERIEVLMRLRNLIPISAKLVLFETAIQSCLTYCQLVWHFRKTSDSRKIVQERGLKGTSMDVTNTGNGERRTGNGERRTGVWELVYSGTRLRIQNGGQKKRKCSKN